MSTTRWRQEQRFHLETFRAGWYARVVRKDGGWYWQAEKGETIAAGHMRTKAAAVRMCETLMALPPKKWSRVVYADKAAET